MRAKRLPFMTSRTRRVIHDRYLELQSLFPDEFPRGSGNNDVPGCEGSATYYDGDRAFYRALCTCGDFEWMMALKRRLEPVQ